MKQEPASTSLYRCADRRAAHQPVAVERRVAKADRRLQNLTWLSLFKGAAEVAVLEAIDGADILQLAAGDVLLKKGNRNDSVFLVLSGALGVYLDESAQTEEVIPIAPDDCLGELSAIDGNTVSATVKALADSRVLHLPNDVFWNRVMAVPGVARNLLVLLARRMRRNTDALLEGQRKEIELKYLRQELDVARQLQIGMLPLRQPLFPERHDLEIAGMMESASSVGGDLFDAFFVDDDRLFFCIGDVSGHGIPAALFMARTVSLMRVAAFNHRSPALLLERVNEQLCAGNDANLFVTLFCGFLELGRGHLLYANAGHLAPVLWKNGESVPLPIPKGTILGVLPGIAYEQRERVLEHNETLLCFTDGVTEAPTPAGEEYSEPRLHGLFERIAHHPLDSVLRQIRADMLAFTQDSRLADDCTMLALRRLRCHSGSLTIP